MSPTTRSAGKRTGDYTGEQGTFTTRIPRRSQVSGDLSSQGGAELTQDETGRLQPSSSPVVEDLSIVDQLRTRLRDDQNLMSDRFYVSALLATDGDVGVAARMIEAEEDFRLVDESLMENMSESDFKDIGTIIAGPEALPTRDEIADNPGPWNPRPERPPVFTGQERRAIGVFEDMVYPRVIDQDLLVDYLEHYRWDIAAAHAQWELDRAEVIKRNQGCASTRQDDSLLNFMMDSGVPFNDNIEQERRDAARVFRDAVNNAAPAGSGALLSISEAILVLVNVSFNLTTAFHEFTGRAAAQEVLSDQYDHMRCPTGDRPDQDERLAMLATITQRVDLNALEGLLADHQWDLIRAMVAWYKDGIAPKRHPKDKDSNKATCGWNRRCDSHGQPRNMPTKEETAVCKHLEKGWALEVNEFVRGGKSKKPKRPMPPTTNSHLGSVIDEDIRTVVRGPPRPAKMLFESIWNGKYWSGTFRHSKYRWMHTDDPDFSQLDDSTKQDLLQKPVFNWYDQSHLEDLNKWRRQRHQRATSDKLRAPSQPFSQDERDYLYLLSKEYVENLMRSTKKSWDDCVKRDIPEAVKDEWTQRFNDEFVGTMPSPHKKPIEPRNVNSLMTQRTRIDKIRQDFKIGQNNGFKKHGAASGVGIAGECKALPENSG